MPKINEEHEPSRIRVKVNVRFRVGVRVMIRVIE